MLNSVLKSSINRLWDKFWSGGISNPLTAIEQISYLLFMKRLDELDIKKNKMPSLLAKPTNQFLKAIKTIYAGATLSRWKVAKCFLTCKQKFFLFLKPLAIKIWTKKKVPKKIVLPST